MKALASAAIKFFRPSKTQSNAPMEVGDRTIASEIIAEVPAEYQYEAALNEPKSKRALLMSSYRSSQRIATGRKLAGPRPLQGVAIVIYKLAGVDLSPEEIHLTEILD